MAADVRQCEYEDYGAFLGFFDHSRVIRLEETRSGLDKTGGFRSNRLTGIRERFCEVAEPHIKPGTQPHFATTFGHTDDLALAFFDHVRDFSRLVSWPQELENYTIAMIPKLSSIIESEEKSHFADPAEAIKELDSDEHPLMTVTHLKLNGIAALAFGLHLQLAAFEVIAARVETIIDLAVKTPLRSEHTILFSNLDDFSNVKCLLLDPMSADDIIMVCFCRNFSVAGSLLRAIRSLTFGDLTTIAPEDPDCVTTQWRHRLNDTNQLDRFDLDADPPPLCEQALVDFSDGRTTKLSDDSISSNHLFISSYTTLSVNGGMEDLNARSKHVRGVVSMHGTVDVSPGHSRQVIDRMRHKAKKTGSQEIAIPKNVEDEWTFALPGRNDLLFSRGERAVNFSDGVTSLEDALQLTSRMFEDEAIEGESNPKQQGEVVESGFQDMSTYLSIPIPSFRNLAQHQDTRETVQFLRLASMLDPEVSASHFCGMSRLEDLGARLEGKFGQSLEDQLANIGLSSPARGSIIRLYNRFIAAIADPLVFDSVVDLIDCFYSLHHFLFNTIPYTIDQCEPQFMAGVLHRHKMIVIEAAEELSTAFRVRMACANSKHDIHDYQMGIGGSINNLFSCADAVLKCASGLLRNYSLHGEGYAKERMFGLVSAQLNERASAQIQAFGGPGVRYFNLIKMDIAHLFQPEQLVRILHEYAHLFYLNRYRTGTTSPIDATSDFALPTGKIFMEDIEPAASELFAEVFVCTFVFIRDVTLYRRYSVNEFMVSKGEVCLHGNGGVTSSSKGFIEILFRIFVASEIVRSGIENMLDSKEPSFPNMDDFSVSFSDYVVSEAHKDEGLRKLNKDEVAAFARSVARIKYWHLALLGPKFSNDIIDVFESHYGNRNVDSLLSQRAYAGECLRNRIPLPITYTQGPTIDEFGIVCATLYNQVVGDEDESSNFGSYCAGMKTLWHISTRQRARRISELFSD